MILGAYYCQSSSENNSTDGQDRKPYVSNSLSLGPNYREIYLNFTLRVDTWKKWSLTQDAWTNIENKGRIEQFSK